MTDYFTETGSAETVNARVGEGTDPRLATVMAALVRHLHAFIKEVQLIPACNDHNPFAHFRRPIVMMCQG